MWGGKKQGQDGRGPKPEINSYKTGSGGGRKQAEAGALCTPFSFLLRIRAAPGLKNAEHRRIQASGLDRRMRSTRLGIARMRRSGLSFVENTCAGTGAKVLKRIEERMTRG